ncbi:MAG TPA: hypothetical protein VGI26_07235 [Solirubrobacteraceae bacterium]
MRKPRHRERRPRQPLLVIDTVLPERGISLYSTYAGHTHTKTLSSHLLLARDAYDAISVEHEHEESQIPVEEQAITAIEH